MLDLNLDPVSKGRGFFGQFCVFQIKWYSTAIVLRNGSMLLTISLSDNYFMLDADRNAKVFQAALAENYYTADLMLR
jgi:hypothetical protein